jgi:hypothetical protein
MSWVSLTSNQCVTCNNLQDAVNNGVFAQKNTIPSSNKEITASEADYYVYINSTGKASNQLVVKGDLVSSGGWYTWFVSPPQTSSCSGYGYYPNVLYTNNPSFLSYATFYTNNALTIEFDGFEQWFMDSTFENGCTIQIGAVGETIAQGCC